ncbi:MBOAT family protein [bacterium]|nr:MBOAT family protein [bacterium]
MVFSSSIFLLYFLPVFLLVYHLVGGRLKNWVILIASILFYSWGAPKFVFVILASTIVDFYIVQKLASSTAKSTRNGLLFTSVLINLGLLLYFKYSNFFIENVNELLSVFGGNSIQWTKVILPIGISFYTFQTLTYSIDVYRKVHAPLDKLSDYLLYIMSFPQMIAGPIVRFNEIADEITNRKEVIDDKLIGFFRFCIGLSKKVLIANVMGQQADTIFNMEVEQLHYLTAWTGILAYTFQIYFDFSGYSDMAIGLGKMMGFHFPENFNSPYTAKNISEFWRKWHITLGAFMRDYLYIPLGGNRVASKYRVYLNLWVVFLLSGLWHGASWNFVLWGAYHGLFLILDRLFLVKLLQKLGSFFSILFTFIVVMLGWLLFRLEDFSEVLLYLKRMFDFGAYQKTDLIPFAFEMGIVAIVFSFFAALKVGKRIQDFIYEREAYTLPQYFVIIGFSFLLFMTSLGAITASKFNPFIYFRF